MAGSSFGTIFQITTWGESHGKGIGVVVDGVPAGLDLNEEDIQIYLNRRKPGQSKYATPRSESDAVEILSGVFEGKTTGTPVSLVVFNRDQHSKDYGNLASCYRPGHADYTFDMKYGFRDYRGGGRSSGRETIGRVAAGAIALKILDRLGISVTAYTKSIGEAAIADSADTLLAESPDVLRERILNNPLYMPDEAACAQAQAYLDQCMQEHNSAGGVIECLITGMPAGIGDTVFEKLDARLADAILSIGAVKGFEIGDGFAAAHATGQTNNDMFYADASGAIRKSTNHSGGVLGGMSDGSPIIFRAAVKPTPSIATEQQTVNNRHENIPLTIHGRHDPIIVPRAVVVVEAMAALTVVDALFRNMSARMDRITDFYAKKQRD